MRSAKRLIYLKVMQKLLIQNKGANRNLRSKSSDLSDHIQQNILEHNFQKKITCLEDILSKRLHLAKTKTLQVSEDDN